MIPARIPATFEKTTQNASNLNASDILICFPLDGNTKTITVIKRKLNKKTVILGPCGRKGITLLQGRNKVNTCKYTNVFVIFLTVEPETVGKPCVQKNKMKKTIIRKII